MTKYLFDKHFNLLYPISDAKTAFDIAIDKQIRLYEAELQKIRSKEDVRDYIADLYDILNAKDKYIKAYSSPKEYEDAGIENGYLVRSNKIYITTASLKNAIYNYYEEYISPKLFIDALHNEGI